MLLASLLLWPILVIAGAMSFDAPGSDEVLLTRLIFLWALIYPVPILIGAIGVWRNRAAKTLGRIKLFTAIALLSWVLPVVFFGLLEVVCDGSFACPA